MNYFNCIFRSLQDGLEYSDIHDPKFSWRTSVPSSLFGWALIAHKAAISDTHVDGEGLCTHIRIHLGRKLWFVGLEEESPNLQGWSSEIKWQVLDLKPGDDLYVTVLFFTLHFNTLPGT
jgi:hypothetical protein